jgi:hypothetical protein
LDFTAAGWGNNWWIERAIKIFEVTDALVEKAGVSTLSPSFFQDVIAFVLPFSFLRIYLRSAQGFGL